MTWSPPWLFSGSLGRVSTRNAAFRRWFGKSVLVLPSGEPRVVYHWTPAAFTKFKAGGPNPKLSGKAIALNAAASQRTC